MKAPSLGRRGGHRRVPGDGSVWGDQERLEVPTDVAAVASNVGDIGENFEDRVRSPPLTSIFFSNGKVTPYVLEQTVWISSAV